MRDRRHRPMSHDDSYGPQLYIPAGCSGEVARPSGQFFVKSIQHPSNHFNISNYVNFCRNPTRSSTSNKLQHNFTSTNKQSNFYFNRLPRTYNSLPVLDLNQPFPTIKSQLLKIFWQHFINNFNSDNPHSMHFVCPCSTCSKSPRPPNFSSN